MRQNLRGLYEIGARGPPNGRLTGSAADIVQSKLGDAGVELEQQRQRLANATGSTEDGNLGQLEAHKKQLVSTSRASSIVELRPSQGGGGTGAAHTLRAEAEKALRWMVEPNIFV